ncbi:MAG TPA: hypothetical protein ENJ79_00480 [Gammaproteobacteria bacterium]|nr:hypothetical protein [Gammaproteobacteria bacterium]
MYYTVIRRRQLTEIRWKDLEAQTLYLSADGEKTGRARKIKELQQILGHANIHTTMSFYLHPDMKQLRDSLDELDDI